MTRNVPLLVSSPSRPVHNEVATWHATMSNGCGFADPDFSDVPFLALWGQKHLPISAPVEQSFADAAAGTLPSVSYVGPRFEDEGTGPPTTVPARSGNPAVGGARGPTTTSGARDDTWAALRSSPLMKGWG